ncbi:hypothetical protein AABH71_002083 [Salmonella enterica]|uniref:hypothetical protein n=1 Tax=Salmonella enterica TaxID=28901 RepID=UPI0012D6D372|nr:hypothetical protein [Salmonella enterica]EBQ9001284.1 hypothetical protein [Salmonella enterica subsp. enterica serovar Blockley]ECU7993224.1 hypothetical protein [Salmonella enterica subsp. enterica serovar Toucra]ECW2125355.1 hypothetical protein [Salmonella enterica]
MSMKQRVIAAIGLHPLAPRWVKILCLYACVGEIEKEFKAMFAKIDKADFPKITPEKREELNALVAEMNLKLKKRIDA